MSICFNPCGGAASVDRGELVFSKNSHSSSPEEKADEPPDHRNQAISVQPKSTVPSERSDMKGLKQTSPVSAAVLPYAEDGLLTRGYRWLAGMFNRVAAWLKPASPSTDSSTGPGNGVPHTPKVNCAEIACDKKAGEKAVLSENKKPDANLAEPGAQDLDMLREVVSDQELKLQDLLWTQCANTKSVPNNSHSTRLPMIMNSTGLRLQQDLLGQIPEKRKPMEGAQHLPQKHTNDTRMFIESEDIPHFHNRSAYDFILYTTIDQNGKGVRVRIPRSPIARRAAPTIHRDRTQNAHYKVLRAMRNSGFLPDTGDPDDTFCKSRQARLKDQRLEDYSQLLDVRLSDGERYKRTERLLQNQGCQVPATKLNGVNKANTDDKKIRTLVSLMPYYSMQRESIMKTIITMRLLICSDGFLTTSIYF
jgi:hypothetical protein